MRILLILKLTKFVLASLIYTLILVSDMSNEIVVCGACGRLEVSEAFVGFGGTALDRMTDVSVEWWADEAECIYMAIVNAFKEKGVEIC